VPDAAGKFKGISVPELPWKRDNAQPRGYPSAKKK
jgi:hypothetical protein